MIYVVERDMRRRYGALALRPHARDLSVLLGSRADEKRLMSELDRFVNSYRLGLEEARRAVLVLHGIPPGLTGPAGRRFTWQTDLYTFDRRGHGPGFQV